MAGVKGRSGGARPNSGPKRKRPDIVAAQPVAPPAGPAASVPGEPEAVAAGTDPLEFLKQVMRGTIDPSPSQLKAAIAAAKYVHRVAGDAGKKEEAAKRADEAAGGKFSPRKAPLKLVNG